MVVINKLDFPIESLKEPVPVYVFCICDRRLRENEHYIQIFKKHDPTLRPPEVYLDDEMNSIHFVFSGNTNLTFMETQPFEGCQSSFAISGRT